MRKASRIALVALMALALALTFVSCKDEPVQNGGGAAETPKTFAFIAKAGDTYDFAPLSTDASPGWQSSRVAVATIDSDTGMLTVAGIGDTVITHGEEEYPVRITTWEQAKWLYDLNGKLDLSGYTALDTTVPASWVRGDGPSSYPITIKEIVFPKGTEILGMYCCGNQRELVSVTFPESLTKLVQFALAGCTNLKTVKGLDGDVTIENDVFTSCTSLPTLIIGKKLIHGDLQADSITIPNGVETICKTAFSGAALSSITIPSSVKTIENTGFYQCQNLANLTIPESVTKIGQYAFNRNAFTAVTVPDSVTTLGVGVFTECPNLESVTIGTGVTAISTKAFMGCAALKTIILRGTTVKPLGTDALKDANAIEHIYVPAESVAAYKAVAGWSAYADKISAIPAT